MNKAPRESWWGGGNTKCHRPGKNMLTRQGNVLRGVIPAAPKDDFHQEELPEVENHIILLTW